MSETIFILGVCLLIIIVVMVMGESGCTGIQHILYNMNKTLSLSHQNILRVISNLERVQTELINSIMNKQLIEEVKISSDNLVHWQEVEDSMLKQRAKLKWLRDGDANITFFQAAVKAKHTSKALTLLIRAWRNA